jgi:hypothetical protein
MEAAAPLREGFSGDESDECDTPPDDVAARFQFTM